MTEVRCKVSSCYYWGNNDICKADSIMVDNDTSAVGRGVRMEAGDLDTNTGRGRNRRAGDRSIVTGFEAGDLDTRIDAQSDIKQSGTDVQSGSHSTNQAQTSHDTICSTFRPKASQPRH